MTDLPLTLKDAARALRAGEVSSVELTRGFIERTDRLDPVLGCFITRTTEQALAAAARADAAFAIGVDKGPLQGIPMSLKDIFSTDDAPTTAQSMAMDPEWPRQGDGPMVRRLRAAGAVIMGKNTTSEFANGEPDPRNPFPRPHNPWNIEHSAGGSSSGTGASVAAGLVLGGIGSDTGGSVRWPSAANGVSGIKPTYGRVPRSGCTQNAISLDHVGPLARSAWDVAAILKVIAGHDVSDPVSAQKPVDDYTRALSGDLAGLRIGVLRKDVVEDWQGGAPETSERFDAAVKVLEEAGATVTPISIPYYRVFHTASWLNNIAEKSGVYSKRFAAQWQVWGCYVRMAGGSAGLFLDAADYVQILRVRFYAQKVIAGIMQRHDLLVSPTTLAAAPPLASVGYTRTGGFGGAMHTGVWSFVGLPALALPMGFTNDQLPLSLQIIGRPFQEATVLRAGDAYQRLTDWHLRVPPIVSATKEEVSA